MPRCHLKYDKVETSLQFLLGSVSVRELYLHLLKLLSVVVQNELEKYHVNRCECGKLLKPSSKAKRL